MNQRLRVEYELYLYDTTDINSTYLKLNNAINSSRFFDDWLDTELDLKENKIVLSGEMDNDCLFVAGCNATRWEPAENPYLEGAISKEELIDEVKKLISNAGISDDVADYEDVDTYAENEYDAIERQTYSYVD